MLDRPMTPTMERSTSAQIRHMIIAAAATISGALLPAIVSSVEGETRLLFARPKPTTRIARQSSAPALAKIWSTPRCKRDEVATYIDITHSVICASRR